QHEGGEEQRPSHLVLGVEGQSLAAVLRPGGRVENGEALALVAGEDALERHAHRTGEAHALQHVARPDAALHPLEILDVDAVDALVKAAFIVPVEAGGHLAQLGREPLDPEVARLDHVSVRVGKLGDGHAGALPRPRSGCQSSDLIERPTVPPLEPQGSARYPTAWANGRTSSA